MQLAELLPNKTIVIGADEVIHMQHNLIRQLSRGWRALQILLPSAPHIQLLLYSSTTGLWPAGAQADGLGKHDKPTTQL